MHHSLLRSLTFITQNNGNVSIIRRFDNPISSIRVSRVGRVSRVRVTQNNTQNVPKNSDAHCFPF